MCGGIAFKISKFSKKQLKQFFTDDQINEAEVLGNMQVYFWSPSAVLPVMNDGNPNLIEWGNRDKNINFPKTGWAREESINDGKWNGLNPNYVTIPAVMGYENGVWFDIKKGIKGLIASRNNKKRVYIITRKSSPDYLKLTTHDREPLFIE